MRSMTAASARGASPPAAGAGAITTFAPSVRNSCVSLRSASRFTLRSAEHTAAPLVSAISATARRPRLAPRSFQRIRRNIEPLATRSLSPQNGSGIDARRASEREETPQQRNYRRESQNNRKQNQTKFGRDAKNPDAQRPSQNDSQRVSENASNQRQK